MADHDQLALLLAMLLVALLLGCMTKDCAPIHDQSCDALWMDCEGIANDYEICSNAADPTYKLMDDGSRWFSYAHCDTGIRTQLLPIPDGCDVTWK